MEASSHYQIIKQFIQIKNTVKKSRFIVSIQKINDEREARRFLKSIVRQLPDATHHCWAYRLSIGNEEMFQSSDAGEPANSAGPPILQAIRREKIINVMVIVSRYFGGTKLGISGLIKAYRDTALSGLRVAGKVKKYPLREYIIENIEYHVLGNILQSVESRAGRIDDIDYGEKVKIIAFLPEKSRDWIIQTVKNVTHGKACIRIRGIRWYD